MINFYQLRAWQLDGIHEQEIVRRLVASAMSRDEILEAWSMAFEVSPESANDAMRRLAFEGVQYDFTRLLERLSDGELDEAGEVLRLAIAEMPTDARNAAGVTRADLERDVADDSKWWDVLEVMGHVEDAIWQTPRYWDLLAEVAVQLDTDPSWFHWRRGEMSHGTVRAELTLHTTAETVKARETRPVWVLGERRGVAAMRIEQQAGLEPGRTAHVRLRPFLPGAWAQLHPGDQITYQQYGEDQGTAKITEMTPPRP